MPKFLRILDERTLFFRWSISNETLSCQLALCQLVIVLVSLAQHVFSLLRHDHVFLCHFNRTAHPDEYSSFLAYDVIIFDFGLFHEILGVQECIANYIDGGYMRCMWCIGQTAAILVLLALPCLDRVAPPWLLWPMLTMESVYCIGLIIFTIAITDKLVHAVLHDLTGHLVWLALIYWLGTATNCFLDYVLWHFYWHLEEEYKHFKSRKICPEEVAQNDYDDENDIVRESDESPSIQQDSESEQQQVEKRLDRKSRVDKNRVVAVTTISESTDNYWSLKKNGAAKPVAV